MPEEIALGIGYFKTLYCPEQARDVISQRIHVQPQILGEQLSAGLEYTALKSV